MTTDFDIEEHSLPRGQRPDAPVRIIATDYFKIHELPLKKGASLTTRTKINKFADRDR